MFIKYLLNVIVVDTKWNTVVAIIFLTSSNSYHPLSKFPLCSWWFLNEIVKGNISKYIHIVNDLLYYVAMLWYKYLQLKIIGWNFILLYVIKNERIRRIHAIIFNIMLGLLKNRLEIFRVISFVLFRSLLRNSSKGIH